MEDNRVFITRTINGETQHLINNFSVSEEMYYELLGESLEQIKDESDDEYPSNCQCPYCLAERQRELDLEDEDEEEPCLACEIVDEIHEIISIYEEEEISDALHELITDELDAVYKNGYRDALLSLANITLDIAESLEELEED